MVSRPPLQPPKSDHPDDKLRNVAEAAAGVLPYAGSILKLLGDLVPTRAQRARKAWEQEVSARTNEHADRLDRQDNVLAPKATLTGTTVQLAVALAEAPGDGMSGGDRTLDDLCLLLPGADRKSVQEAAFELDHHGLVIIQRFAGAHWLLRLAQKFYDQIDHQVMEWKPATTEDNARVLAQLLLADEAREWTPTLHAASGWEKRRFNPAFAAMLRIIPDAASNEVQANYPAQSLVLREEHYFALRRFVADDRECS